VIFMNISLKVSVVIPVYNCGESFHRTMRSVFSQTYPSIEVILVDDGSTDNSYNTAKEYEGKQVQFLQQKIAGAHVGGDSIEMCRLYPGSQIHSFEPVPDIFKLLKHNTRKFDRIKCHTVALIQGKLHSQGSKYKINLRRCSAL
jgi:glycosyltransferase involved in cell wall biosynthesis